MSWVTSPAATELEQVTMDWLRRLLGFPEHLKGVIQDTASTATLSAVIAGRDAAWRRAGRDADIVFYASDEAHSSVVKAARLAGFRPEQMRAGADRRPLAMRPDALRGNDGADVGRAGAGGTRGDGWINLVRRGRSGPRDRRDRPASTARSFTSTRRGPARRRSRRSVAPTFDGLELADTVVMNPHKWMGVNFDCSVLFIRDVPAWLRDLFAHA